MKKYIFIALLFLFGLAIAYSDTVIVGGPLTSPVAISDGGTGATTAAGAKTNLGLDGVATYDNITGFDATKRIHASFNFYTTTSPTFLNLTTASFQELKPFAIKSTFGNISGSTTAGKVTFKASGTYKVTMRMSVRATQGATIQFQTIKNDTIIVNKTLKRFGLGPYRDLVYANISTVGGSTSDIISYANSGTIAIMTNVTSTQKIINAAKYSDMRYWHINEGTGTPGWLAKLTFSNVDSPDSIQVANTAYDGNAHRVKIQAYNAAFGRYTSLTNTGSDYLDGGALPDGATPLTRKDMVMPEPHRNYVNSNKQTKIQIHHIDTGSATHDFELDQVRLVEGLESFYLEHTEIASFVAGDTLKIRVATDKPGTEFYRYVTGLKIDKIGR